MVVCGRGGKRKWRKEGKKREREIGNKGAKERRKKEEAELSSSWQSYLVDMFLYLIASLFCLESLIMNNLLN